MLACCSLSPSPTLPRFSPSSDFASALAAPVWVYSGNQYLVPLLQVELCYCVWRCFWFGVVLLCVAVLPAAAVEVTVVMLLVVAMAVLVWLQLYTHAIVYFRHVCTTMPHSHSATGQCPLSTVAAEAVRS